MNDVSGYSFLTYKFNDLSLRRLAFTAAGADERVHDGNRFLASIGQPLISLFAAEILKARNVQLSKLHSFVGLLGDKATHAKIAKAWRMDEEITLSPKHGNRSKTVLSFALCAYIGALWQDTKYSVEITREAVQAILDFVLTQAPPDVRYDAMENARVLDITPSRSTEYTQSQVFRTEPMGSESSPINETINQAAVARPEPYTVTRSFFEPSPQFHATGTSSDLLMVSSATDLGSIMPRFIIEQDNGSDLHAARVEYSVESLDQATSFFQPPPLISPSIPEISVLHGPQNRSSVSPHLSDYVHSGFFGSPSFVLPDWQRSQSPVFFPTGPSMISQTPQLVHTPRITTTSRRGTSVDWIKKFITQERRKRERLPVAARHQADLQPIQTILEEIGKSCPNHQLPRLATAILPSSDSLIGFKRTIESYRRSLSETPWHIPSITPKGMLQRISDAKKRMQHDSLVIRVLSLRLYLRYRDGSGTSDQSFIIGTGTDAFARSGPGRPRNVERSNETIRMMQSMYPDLEPGFERYDELFKEITLVRRLGHKLFLLTQSFADQTGILAFLNPLSHGSAKVIELSDNWLIKCPEEDFSKLIRIVTSQSRDRILKFVAAATPIVDGIVDRTLSSENEYLIEKLIESNVMERLAGSLDLLLALNKLE